MNESKEKPGLCRRNLFKGVVAAALALTASTLGMHKAVTAASGAESVFAIRRGGRNERVMKGTEPK